MRQLSGNGIKQILFCFSYLTYTSAFIFVLQ